MVAKESVKSRFERPDQGISYTEFSYMLLQAYDFLRLHLDHGCDVQFGGSDQWGNITMGVDFIRKVCGDEVWGFTTPLIVKADGTKYGKTEIGHGLARSGAHQPLRHVPVLPQHARRAGGRAAPVLHLPRPRRDHRPRPPDGGAARSAARRSGRWPGPSSALVHGEAEVAKCEEASAALFGEEIAGLSEEMLLAVTEDAPTTERAAGRSSSTASPSSTSSSAPAWPSPRSEARRTVEQGGAYVNNVRQTDDGRTFAPADLLHDRYLVLRKGRREVHIVRAT